MPANRAFGIFFIATILIALMLLLAPKASASDIEWKGTTNTVWATGTNWTGSSKPGTADSALFDTSFSNQPNLTGSEALGGLWITTGVAQNVTLSASTGTLTLNGTTINGNATTGIFVDNTSAFTLTITAPLSLGNSQSWLNNSGNLLTIGGMSLNGKALRHRRHGHWRDLHQWCHHWHRDHRDYYENWQ